MPIHPQSPAEGSVAVEPRELIFLSGRPPLPEFLGFVENRAYGGELSHRGELADQWRTANDRVRLLTQSEAGIADQVAAVPLPASLGRRREALLSDPTIAITFSIVPIELALVDLDRLVVHQKFIDLGYVAKLSERLPDEPTAEELFNFALPLDGRYDVPPAGGQIAANAFGFTSPSTDLRVLGQQLLDPRSVAGLHVPGRPTAIVAVAIGYGSNVLSAIRVNGRLILQNGSHRAYTLRAAGHQLVPCLIQNVTRPEELEAVLEPAVLQQHELYFAHPRPPMLRDYFDPELHVRIPAPKIGRQVRIVFQPEVTDLPIA
jgi:hypothetical protein